MCHVGGVSCDSLIQWGWSRGGVFWGASPPPTRGAW